jgi:hypothetical protein
VPLEEKLVQKKKKKEEKKLLKSNIEHTLPNISCTQKPVLKPDKTGMQRQRLAEIVTTDTSATQPDLFSSVKPGWWGETFFSSGGCLDGLQTRVVQPREAGFTEETQTGIYAQAQNSKSAGRKGLGVGKAGIQM